MSQKKKNLLEQSGQLIIEAILLMTLFFGIAVMIQKQFKDQSIISAMVAGPWAQVSGMISNGVWKPETEGRPMHPQGNNFTREGDVQ